MEGVIFEKLAKVAEKTGFSGAEILPAAKTSLKYVNGQDTVTYFGIILFNA